MRVCFIIFAILLFTACNESDSHSASAIDSFGNSGKEEKTNKEVLPITPVKITGETLPATIKYKGKLYEAWQWQDRLGDNIFITSIVEPYHDKEKNEFDEQAQTAELHAFQFIKKQDDWKLLWKISDKEKSCPFDITAAFIKNSTTITDLDSNGIAETTVQYKLACRSDVSPSFMKLIMHQDTVKYSLRGLMWIKAVAQDKFALKEDDLNLEVQPKSDDEYESYLRSIGRYESEKEFANAPSLFLFYAKKQWYKHVVETFE